MPYNLDYVPEPDANGLYDLPPTNDDDGFSIEGYDWIDIISRYHFIPGYWTVISTWGNDGWPAGNWPYVIYGYADPTDGIGTYGIFTYCEGDTDTTAYATGEERDHALNTLIADHWRFHRTGPADLPETGYLPHHTGPYTPRATSEPTH